MAQDDIGSYICGYGSPKFAHRDGHMVDNYLHSTSYCNCDVYNPLCFCI